MDHCAYEHPNKEAQFLIRYFINLFHNFTSRMFRDIQFQTQMLLQQVKTTFQI